MSSSSRFKVLLAARQYAQSFINLPHLMANAGLDADVVLTPGNYLRHSRWLHRCFVTADDDRAFSQKVCERLRSGEYHFLMIIDEPALTAIYADPCSRDIVDYLPMHPDGVPAKTVGRKDLFHRWCDAHDIPTPRTITTSCWEATEKACEELGWPCVLKGASGSGGQTVFIVHDLDQARMYRNILARDSAWLVQEFVVGKLGSAPFLAWRGELRAWMAFAKSVCLSEGKGPRVIGDAIDNVLLEKVCEKIARAGGLHALTGFDFIETAGGDILVIDPHFGRSMTTFHFGQLCNVDFGIALKDAIQGIDSFQGPQPCSRRGVKYPEAIEFVFEKGLMRLLREAPLFSQKVKYFWIPPGDWKLFLIMTAKTVLACSRIVLGAWKAKLMQRAR